MRRLLTLMSVLVAAPGFAATPRDHGKNLLPKLFEGVISPVANATVRVLGDGKPVALGTVMTPDGYILTKGSELKGALTVKTRDGTTYDAQYVGYHRDTDLALLKVAGAKLVTAKLSPGKTAQPGDWVAVSGITSEPLAVGVVSAAARKLFGPEGQIQNVNKGYIGIMFALRGELEIGDVVKGAAAERAKLKVGDIIFEVAGKVVKTREQLLELLDGKRPGDKVVVKVRRKVKGSDDTEDVVADVILSPKKELGKGTRGDIQNSMGSELSGRRTGFPHVIQHDTVVLPRDCGGPLVDLDGRVVGLNIARAGRVETWALTEEDVLPVFQELKAGKFPPPKSATTAKTMSEPNGKSDKTAK